MPFQYTATNTDGKRLTGIINADTESSARDQLNTLGFSILDIKSIAESPPHANTNAPDLLKFTFEAIDKNGKIIKGTVPAKTPYLAFKRLMEEYHFNVTALSGQTAQTTTSEPIILVTLQNQYDLEKHDTKNTEIRDKYALSQEFLIEKELVIQQVDSILKKVKILLAQYESKLSADKRAEIEGYIDKLLRIKSSNNLDYIKNTCKELLQKIQTDEIFLTTQQHDTERQALLMESQKMMFDLSKAAAARVDLGVKLKIGLENLEQKIRASRWAFLLNPINELKKRFTKDPEEEHLLISARLARGQVWDALLMTLKAPASTRKLAWQNVLELRAQQKIINQKLKELRANARTQKKLIPSEHSIVALEELYTFSGWLLGLYLVYYFLGHYVVTRELGWSPILGIPFNLKESALFKYLIALMLILHGMSGLKINFFSRNRLATPILGTLTFGLTVITLFNI